MNLHAPTRALIACAATLFWLSKAPGALLPELQPVDRDELARMPASAQLVVAVSDVQGVRATRAGQALGEFLTEVGTWNRSRQAWEALAGSLGFAPGDAISHLSSGRVLLLAQGLDSENPMHALLGAVPPDVEHRVRERLRPVPGQVEEQTSLLTLEGGAFWVATSLNTDPPGVDLLIAPKASRALFEAIAPALSGQRAPASLGATSAFAALKGLRPGGVEVLYAPPTTPAQSTPVFALSGDLTSNLVDARFAATPEMLTEPVVHTPWPARAADVMWRNSLLFVAGSPTWPEPKKGAATGDLLAHASQTLLVTLLGNLNLTPELKSHVKGVAMFSAQAEPEVPGAPPEPLSLSIAVPVDSLASVIPKFDLFMAQFAGAADLAGASGPLAEAGQGAVRILSLSAKELPLLAGAFGAGSGERGSVAWGFVRADSEPDSGWWVLSVRGGEREEAVAAAGVQELCAALAEPRDPDDETVFALAVRPAELVARAALATRSEARNPLRWLARVDTSMRRHTDGEFTGAIRIDMNDRLLDAAPSAPPLGK